MIGVEFASPTTVPHDLAYCADAPKNMSSRVSKKCLEKGMYILTTSIYQVVRFIPPLNISKEDLEKGTKIFAEAVEEVVREGWTKKDWEQKKNLDWISIHKQQVFLSNSSTKLQLRMY